MPNPDGPWKRVLRPRRARSIARIALWLAFVLAIGIAVWKLAEFFPGQVSSGIDQARLVRLLLVLALVSSGIIYSRQVNLGEVARSLAVWIGLTAVVLLGFTFQSELRDIAVRVRSELLPGEPVSAAPHVLVLTASQDGHFYVFGEANGTRVKFLVDTGASEVVLSPSDAQRIGIDLNVLRFTHAYETANGRGWGAPLTLASLSVGPIALSNVRVSINQSAMSSSLLGMSFLRRMESFEIKDRKLFLRWR